MDKPQVEVCQDGTSRIRDREGRDRIIVMRDAATERPMVLICRIDGRVAASVGFPTNGDVPTVLLHDQNQKINAGFQFQETGEVIVAAFDSLGVTHTESTEKLDAALPRRNIFHTSEN